MKIFAAAMIIAATAATASADERALCREFIDYIGRDIAGWQEIAKTMRAYEVTAKLSPEYLDAPEKMAGMGTTVSAITQSLVSISKARSDDAVATIRKLRSMCPE